MNRNTGGHLVALLTILVWGTTFVSIKMLLEAFSPTEILLFRFVLGYATLWLIYPKPLKLAHKRQEIYFIGAGLCGVMLYYFLENIALTYTFASNVGVIVSIGPFFTGIFAHFLLKGEKLSGNFLIGFLFAVAGIILIGFNGAALQLHPLGDLLAVLAAAVWAVYSILTKTISGFRYNIIQTTRRTFGYGLIFMLPAVFWSDFSLNLERFAERDNLLNLLFLGFIASAMCFVTWSQSVKILGVVRSSVYIYIVPVVTVITSAIVLRERITGLAMLGTALTLLGLFLSGSKIRFRVNRGGAAVEHPEM
ncbi:DMT family transporter ['Paenibacillus yunnanensis' Narsing Rao et al. 2020]|uniref:DMT family transporter n=1 Tax=Paenibacillus tengchongensis TaxID=2608684 RepID=UPI00124CD3C0|nr:DMT family transporter [Paenibacillus tengchongensis]